jgi:large subunit ribosomal protein L9
MQVVLLKNVPKLGKKYDVVEVSNGYAMNRLFPGQFATPATKHMLAQIDKKREGEKQAQEARKIALKELIVALKDAPIVVTTKADPTHRLYKKIHAKDISAIIKEKYSIELEEEALSLDETIASVGEHTVHIHDGDVKGDIVVKVEEE